MHSGCSWVSRTYLVALLVSIVSETVRSAEFLQPIPYLYFSFNDSDVNYIEFTKYYNLEGTMNPVLEADPSMNLKLIQPFEFSNMTTKPPLVNNQSLQDCTVATTSVSEFGAMVCKNNFFFIYSVDRVMAIQDLNKIDDPAFVPGGSLACQSAFIDLELALGFVTCLKTNDSAAGIEIMAVQLLDGADLQWSKLNWLLPNSSSDPSPTNIKAVVAQINKRPNSNQTSLMVQTLEIVLVIGSPFGQSGQTVHPKVLYELQFAISISNLNIRLTKLKNSVGIIELVDFFLNQNVVLIDLIGAPETKFYETFDSSLMLLTQSLTETSGYASDYGVFFIKLERLELPGVQGKTIKEVRAQFKEKTQIMVDSRFLYIINPLVIDSGVVLQLRRVDIFSFFNQFYTDQSAIIYNSVEVMLPYNQTSPEPELVESGLDDTPAVKVTLGSSPNLLAGIVNITSSTAPSNSSYFFVWDLASLSLKVINSTDMNIRTISMSQTNGESLVVFPYTYPGSSKLYLGKMSSSRAYIGIPKIDGDFDLQAHLKYDSPADSKQESFYLTGTYIKNLSSFIQLPESYFEQTFSYYTELSYDIYLPWNSIRGVDISISPNYIDDVQVRPQSLELEYLDLGMDDLQPDIYFIKSDFLVLMTKNFTAQTVTIMIFKVESMQTQEISYKSENNYTISSPANGPSNSVLDVNQTQLRNVEVLFDNIVTLVELIYTVGSGAAKKNYTEAMLLSFYGPNYLKGNKSITLERPGFYAAIVPNIETVCYLIISTSKDYKSTFLAVYNITMENMESSELIALFNSSSNIRPTFCPVQLFPDTIDNQYLIVVSSCPAPPGQTKTYTMKLDLVRLVVSEYQKERVIDKGGNICPASGSFVSINSKNITGYVLPAGKSVFSSVQFYINDFVPSNPYDSVCFINRNLLVVSQTHSVTSPSTGNVTYKTVAYIFSTDSTVEADRRLLQRVAFPDEIQKLTISYGDDIVYLQPTSRDPYEDQLVRYVVYLKKKDVKIQYPNQDGFSGLKNVTLEFNTIDKTSNQSIEYKLNFSTPQYSATLQPIQGQSVSPENLNGTLINSLFNITGPVYAINISASTPNNPALGDSPLPRIVDGWIESKASIRAPIFSYFDIFQGVDQELFIGIVNYPYGFDICVLDAKFLQYPQVTSISGLNAISAKTIKIGGKLYLFVYNSDISDDYISLSTYFTNGQDWSFSSGVSYSSTLFLGEMDIQLMDQSVPTFLVTFFSQNDEILYLFMVNFRELNSDALADINPFSRLINVAQVETVARPDVQAVFLIYRKEDQPASLYYRAWMTPGKNLIAERPVFENSATFKGANEELKCSSFEQSIDCVMAVEGNYFVEVRINVTMASFTPDDPLPVPTLTCLSTKQYLVYVNNKIERLDFSEDYIYAQTKTIMQDESQTTGPTREILIYSRAADSHDLYKGIPCSQYSDACSGPIYLVPWSRNQSFFASQTGMYLVQSLVIKNRTLELPTGFDPTSWDGMMVVVSNPFESLMNTSVNFTSLVKITPKPAKSVLYFRTWTGVLFIAVPLFISLLAFRRDLKERKLNESAREALYFSSDAPSTHRSSDEGSDVHEEMIKRRKTSKQTNESEDEQKIPSGVFDGPTQDIKRNLARSMRQYLYDSEQSPVTP